MTEMATQAPGVLFDRTINLGRRLMGLFYEQQVERQPLEVEWLKDERQYKGVYEGEDLKRMNERAGTAKEFMRITRMKCLTLDARIMDLDSGTGKKNWAIRPDDDPDDIEIMGSADEQDDQQLQAAQDQNTAQITSQAARAENMDRTVYAQLQHSEYMKLKRKACHSGHKFGTGILKGPMVTKRQIKKWTLKQTLQGTDAGPGSQETPSDTDPTWQITFGDDNQPAWEFVKVWDYYPEMEGWDLANTEYCFQRHLFHKSDLLSLAAKGNFFGDAIKEYVASRPDGDAKYLTWETELDAIGRYTATLAMVRRRKYEIVEYWGPVSADELKALGKNLPEEIAGMVEAHVWFVNSTGAVIAADINPTAKKERPYSFYVPFNEEGHLFGESVPSIMRDPQKLLNATIRMMADNAASAVLPQVELDVSRVPTAKNITAMPPGRIWAVQPDPYGNNSRAINFSDFPNHTQMYLLLAQFLGTKLDEISGIPAYAQGANPGTGAGRTSSGLSMLMGAAGLILKNQLFAWDEFQSRIIMLAYDWNMQFNPDPTIKGNFKVHVVGSMSLALREMRAEQIKQIIAVAQNPEVKAYMKIRELYWMWIEENEIDPSKVMKTKKELMAETAQMNAQTAAAAKDPAKLAAQQLAQGKVLSEILQNLGNADMAIGKAGGSFTDTMGQLIQMLTSMLTNLHQQPGIPAPAEPDGDEGQGNGGAPAASGAPQPTGTTPVTPPGPGAPTQVQSADGGRVVDPSHKLFLDGLLTDSQNPRTSV